MWQESSSNIQFFPIATRHITSAKRFVYLVPLFFDSLTIWDYILFAKDKNLQMIVYNHSKVWMIAFNPSNLRSIKGNPSNLRRIKGKISNLRMITFNPPFPNPKSNFRRFERLNAILQTFERDYSKNIKIKCNPSNLRRITRNHLNLKRIKCDPSNFLRFS